MYKGGAPAPGAPMVPTPLHVDLFICIIVHVSVTQLLWWYIEDIIDGHVRTGKGSNVLFLNQ